jgi:hypothetical protein
VSISRSSALETGFQPFIPLSWSASERISTASFYDHQAAPVLSSTLSFSEERKIGFDHGAGHPLLFLDDAKAPNYQKNNGFSDLGNYSAWPKVAGAVIQTEKFLCRNVLIIKKMEFLNVAFCPRRSKNFRCQSPPKSVVDDARYPNG